MLSSCTFRRWMRMLILAGFGVSALVLALPLRAAGDVLYAAPGGLTSGSCTSWATACTLSYALSIATSGDQIWVKKGVHKPDVTGLSNPRLATFSLKEGVAIYGGFAGTETSLGQRSWTSHPTILSGDIDNNDVVDANGATLTINGANVYHVVTANGVSNAAVLNGFTITGGQATDPDNSPDQGAGIYNINASPTLANLLITGNTAQYGGAGMYNQGTSSPSVFAVTFRRNDVMSYGGGVYNEDSSSPTLINVSFISNTATYGGGFFNGGGTLTLSLVQFQENRAGQGGAIFNDAGPIQLLNANFISNTAQYGGGIWTFEGGLTAVNSEFRNNQADGSGGAIYSRSSEIDITDSSFVNNSSNSYGGGGLYHSKFTRETVARLTNVTFEGNNGVGGHGGGMYVFQASAQLDKVRFVNNAAVAGGGMSSVFGKSIVLTDTVFIGNTASSWGGGMSTLLTERDMTLTNVLFSGNTSLQDGGGMRNENAAFRNAKFTLTNVTFSGNTAQNRGGALLNIAETITLTNVIIWGNTASINSGLHNDSSDLLIAHSDVQGCGGSGMWNSACGIDGGGNIDTDPLFVDANGPDDLVGTLDDDLRLQTSSPAIDAGNNAAVPDSLSTDLDGNLRIQDGDGDNSAVVDMGAYEAEDVYPPTVISVTRGDANPTNAASVTFIVNFSEPVIGVDATDFTVTTTGVSGAAVSSVSGSGTTYIVTVSTGSGDGMLRLDIPTSAMISDVVGNGLTGLPYQAGEAYTIDKTGPTVDLEQAAEQADPTNTTPISFTVVFNEPINAATFSASDVALDWSASGEITATVAEIAPFNGTVFRIAVSGMDRSGVITVSIPAGMIEDLIGNLNLASTSMDNTVTYWDPNSDSDGDGLNDWDEVQLGTNPNASDSDGDGMPDGWEVANGLNPNSNDASGDPDNDGLSNLQEYQHSTNPNASDSDGDGMPDGWEVANGLNPNSNDASGDPDNDGLSNLQEYQHDTNPNASDSDGDGMPDDWEVANGLNPNSNDASGDPDNDGLSNLQEYQHSTNPNASDSDGDGMPDGWEVANGLNPTNPGDASEDSDGDGQSNLQEYLNGTDPNVSDSLTKLFLPLLQKSN